MEVEVFERLRAIIYEESGISLGRDKISLMANRIGKRIRALGLKDEKNYLEIIETNHDGVELLELIDAVSTNVTFFFREEAHFEFLKKQAQIWAKEKRPEIKAWCAASSSGEEPYSILMTINEVAPLANMNFRLLATDICSKVLERAQNGIFQAAQFRDTAPKLVNTYFENLGNEKYHVKPTLQKYVVFKRLNLSKFPLPLKGPLDIIFCRNVMIYFDLKLRQQLISEFYRLLRPNGFLLIGHSENLLGIKHGFQTVQTAVYKKEL